MSNNENKPDNKPDSSWPTKRLSRLRYRGLTKEEYIARYKENRSSGVSRGTRQRGTMKGRWLGLTEMYEAADLGAKIGFYPGLALMALAYTNAVPGVSTAVSAAQRVIKGVFNVNW